MFSKKHTHKVYCTHQWGVKKVIDEYLWGTKTGQQTVMKTCELCKVSWYAFEPEPSRLIGTTV